ncbi:hypothetical protein [Flindersiella endophytica]
MVTAVLSAGTRWWFAPLPLARVAVLRLALYLFVIVDIRLFVNDVPAAGFVPELYRPLLIGRLLHLPTPTPLLVEILQWGIPLAALVAASGRLPRLAGLAVGLGYLWWLTISMSYGKVDHDHMAIIVAMLVLPTVGRARFGDRTPSQAAGWAVRCLQVATVATYFLSAVTKARNHGWTFGWASGAVLTWAITRRPTPISEPLLQTPWLLHVLQWIAFLGELLSPAVLFLRRRALMCGALFWLGFHLTTWLFLGIHFLPTAICWLAFAPLERLVPSGRRFEDAPMAC